MGSKYEWALFLHLLGVVVFFSGAAVATIAFEAARRRNDSHDVATLLGLARAGAALVGIGTLVLLAFGLWLVDLGDWGFDGWIAASLGLLIVAAALGAAGGQRPKRARLLAAGGAADTTQLRRLLDDPLARTLNYASGVAALVVLALMVFKPGA